MQTRAKLQRRYFSALTAVVLIANLVLPTGWMAAPRAALAASTYTWPFTNAGDYTVDDNLMIAADASGSYLHYRLNGFDSTGLGTGFEAVATVTTLYYDSSDTLWGVNSGKTYTSADNGANWAAVTDATLAAMQVTEIVQNSHVDATPGANLVATGSLGGSGTIAYSFDGGTTWNPAVFSAPAVTTDWVAVDYDSSNDALYALSTNGIAAKSTNGGETWDPANDTYISPNKVVTGCDVVVAGAGTIAIMGSTGGGDGAINYSTDGGTNWANAAHPALAGQAVSSGFYSTEGWFWAQGASYLVNLNLNTGTFNDAADWTNVSANLEGGVFSPAAQFLPRTTGVLSGGTVIFKIKAAAGYRIYSTIDNGQTFNLHYTDPSVAHMSGPIVFNNDCSTMLVAGDNPDTRVGDVWSTTVSPANTSVVTAVGPSSVASIQGVVSSYHAWNYGTPKISLANSLSGSPTWYYPTGVGTNWDSSTNDDSSKAMSISGFTAEIWAAAPAALFSTGNIFLKIYTPSTDSMMILDSLALDYTEGVVNSVTVTSPNGGEKWQIDASYPITWTSTGTITNVKIELSRDNGGSWETLVASTPDDGVYNWTVTGDDTSQALVRISKATDASVNDMSNAVFAIVAVGGDIPDTTPPTSELAALPRYSKADKCAPTLHLEATANDDRGPANVASVWLYASTDGGNNFAPWNGDGMPDTVGPEYTWDISVTDGTTYYFYSMAIDASGNREIPPVSPKWDTMTTIDATAPTVSDSTPIDRAINVGINQPVVFTFSESLVPETFTYAFEQVLAGGSVIPVTGLELTWSNNYTKITVAHNPLEYSADYRFNITNATDPAGNQLNNVTICRPPGCDQNFDNWPPNMPKPPHNPDCDKLPQPPMPKLIHFSTQPNIDPNLLDSKLEAAAGHNSDGSYNAGDEVQFTLTLINNGNSPAENVLARISAFTNGISYVRTDDKGGGTIMEYKENGKVVRWDWRNGINNPIVNGQPVVIKLTVKVDNPYLFEYFQGNLQAAIYDNVTFTEEPDNPFYLSDSFNIAHNAVLATSTMTVAPALVKAGDTVTYQVEIYNTGTTIGDIWFEDFVPSHDNLDGEPPIFYSSGSLDWDKNDNRWGMPPEYDEASQTIRGLLNNLAPGGAKVTLEFKAVVRGSVEPGTDVLNTAYVYDGNNLSQDKTKLEATVSVEEGDPTPPLVITYRVPEQNSFNNPLHQPIRIGFNLSVNTETFVYELAKDGQPLTDQELADWTEGWGTADGSVLDNTLFTLEPPLDGFESGFTYTMTVVTAYDTDGNALKPMPDSWDFTPAYPTIKITKPTSSLYELQVNKVSEAFEVSLFDDISGQPYKAEFNVTIKLKAGVGGVPRKTADFYDATKKKLSGNPAQITIPRGTSTATFYYSDSKVTDPIAPVRIVAYETPYLGWDDGVKYVQVTTDAPPAESIIVTGPEQATVGAYSAPFIIQATDADGQIRYLPEGKLYLYTDSATGAFYESKGGVFRKLPLEQAGYPGDNLTIQDIAPQYVTIGANVPATTLYYLDANTGLSHLTVSDNTPQLPDLNLNDAEVILNVAEVIEDKELDKELEEVKDDTGRLVDKIKLAPSAVTLLPGGKQDFTATAYDASGKPIKGLKFGWFVLLDKSGKIEKVGHGDSHISTFTAGTILGTYNDTVLVATLYNGKLAYQTASVKVVDVVNYKGPQRLPVTGMNGLQLVLMGLTLMAAVALAWVEHYDKTHFKPENNA